MKNLTERVSLVLTVDHATLALAISSEARLERETRVYGRIGFFTVVFAVESERARARQIRSVQFLRGLLRFKVDLGAATASLGFDHRRRKK